jgi:L-iditol 2-dehydrogenase
MKAALLMEIKKFEIKDVPIPEIVSDNDVLVKTKTIGVCGSDVHYYNTGRIGSQIVQFPFIIGHETAGIVERVGSKVSKVKPGQRVAIDPAVSCGHCDQCLSGRENTCRELLFLGCPKQLDGCLSEYLVIHEKCCFPIKESMSFVKATLSEPLAIGVYSVERGNLPDNADIGILGAGPIGMSVFHVLRTKNVGDVYITDKIEDRLIFSKQLNPKWSGNPDHDDVVKEISKLAPFLLDVVFECSGDVMAINQAIQLLKPGGTLVIVGITEVDEITLPIHELRRKEISIINIRRQVHCTQKALDFLDSGQINMDSMATHHFQLEETHKAFDLVANYKDGVMKAIITLD